MTFYYKILVALSFLSVVNTMSGQSYLDKSFGVEGSVSIPLVEYQDIKFMGQDSTGQLYLESEERILDGYIINLIELNAIGEENGTRRILGENRTISYGLLDNTIYSKNKLFGSTIIEGFRLDLSPKFRYIIPKENVSTIQINADDGIIGITSREDNSIVTAFKYNTDGSLSKDFGEDGLIEIYEEEAYARLHRHSNGLLYILTSRYPSAERVMLRRYNKNGQIDTSIGEAGALKLDIQIESITSSLLRSVSELSDGSFLNAYILYDEDFTNYLGYAKYDEDGEQDMNFGKNGYLGLLQNIGEFGYTSRFITQTANGHLLFHYTTRDSITNDKSEFRSLYDIDGNKIKTFADDGVLELTDLPIYKRFSVSVYSDDIYIDYQTGIREDGESFSGTHHVLSKLDLSEYLEEGSQNSQDAFKIYPNPFTESLTIENDGPKLEDVEIRIYDMLGQKTKVIFMNELRRNQVILDLPDLISGIYIIQIVADGEVVKIKKVMRQ